MALAVELFGNPQKPRRVGVALWLVPPGAGFALALERAPDASGAPGTWAALVTVANAPAKGSLYLDENAEDGALYWYRLKTTAAGFQDSDYLGPIQAQAGPLDGALAAEPNQANARLYPTIAAPGTVAQGATYDDGTGARAFAVGVQRGTVAHGGTVTFPSPYQNVPRVRLWGGLTYEPRSAQWSGGTFDATKPQYEDFAALNLTAAGFTARARLRQVGTPTLRSHEFSGTPLAVGDTEAVTLANAPANNDTYTVTLWVRIVLRSKVGTLVRGTVTLAIDSSSDAGANWTERDTLMVTHQTTSLVDDELLEQYVRPITVSGLDSTDKVRIRLIDFSVTGLTNGVPLGEIIGADNGVTYSGHGVAYYTSTDLFATKTPATGDVVSWEAVG